MTPELLDQRLGCLGLTQLCRFVASIILKVGYTGYKTFTFHKNYAKRASLVSALFNLECFGNCFRQENNR